MAQASQLYKSYFLQYASYVIRDRAIPDLIDGLKPVQRRILWSLITMDDGKFHKVANVVGETMKYHPHGDAAIYGALVTLANCDLFIERQGNYGNILTGEPAAAGRYIECRLQPIAKQVLYNPELTTFVPSYDGRAKEPLFYPAKIPVVLIQGVQGIAVGMNTIILPHNPIEVLDAMKASIRGEKYELYPDCPTGGIMDVSDYDDGKGKVAIRAKIDISDPKRVVIEELPYTVTSEAMIDSIKKVKDKLKISAITDYTTDHANIEIDLQRGVQADKNFVKQLYAYTACETKISVNPLVIKDNLPVCMGVHEIIDFHAQHLMSVLKAELDLKKKHLNEDLVARTLDRIFIEERIYKRIESKKTAEDVKKAVITGLKPFESEISRPVNDEDVERLLKIPIRRISLFDINQNRSQIEEINKQIADCNHKLKHLVDYTLASIEDLKSEIVAMRKKSGEGTKRRTQIKSFDTIDVKEVAKRDKTLMYDPVNGYLGYEVKDGNPLFAVSEYDRILVIRKDGVYMVMDVPDREFVDKGMLWCGFADKEQLKKTVFSLLYQERKYKYLFIKRFQITAWMLRKEYRLLPEGNFRALKLSTLPNAEIEVQYLVKPGVRMHIKSEKFYFGDYAVRNPKAGGFRLTVKELASLKLRAVKEVVSEQPDLFGAAAKDDQSGKKPGGDGKDES